MKLENEAHELELIAGAFQRISKEISYTGLANALLREALCYCGAARGGVLLSEEGELLAKAGASFPRERARVFTSQPSAVEFRMPADLSERILDRQETVLRDTISENTALIGSAPPSRIITQLFLPMAHQGLTIGVLYLEAEQGEQIFTARCVWVTSMLASQTAVSFNLVRLFEALRETNMWMVRGQEIGRMGSYRWNTRTLLSRASRECYRIFDIDLAINPVPFEVFRCRVHPDDLGDLEKSLGEAVNAKSPFSREYRIVHRNGEIRHVAAVGQFDEGPSGDVELEGIAMDVSDRKASEQALADARNELARASRLASVGELAGSIIHEINQPLTGIIMSAEANLHWLARNPSDPDSARRSAIRVIEHARRATDVIASLRSLVQDAQLQLVDVDINEAIEEVLRLSKREFEHGSVTLQTNFDRSLPNIEGDRVQLQQVVLNLVRNAIEAMVAVEGRTRILTASSKGAGDHISVRISDTGVGINRSEKDSLFDAFYTTKGSGLGLGLSICRKIVTVHGGRLWVEENTVYGATFIFVLPVRQSIRLLEGN